MWCLLFSLSFFLFFYQFFPVCCTSMSTLHLVKLMLLSAAFLATFSCVASRSNHARTVVLQHFLSLVIQVNCLCRSLLIYCHFSLSSELIRYTIYCEDLPFWISSERMRLHFPSVFFLGLKFDWHRLRWVSFPFVSTIDTNKRICLYRWKQVSLVKTWLN